MKNDQEKLAYIVQSLIEPKDFPSLRGILGMWDNNVLRLSFVFERPFNNTLLEDAAVLATEILSQYPNGLVKDKYLHLQANHKLPKSPYWVFRKN